MDAAIVAILGDPCRRPRRRRAAARRLRRWRQDRRESRHDRAPRRPPTAARRPPRRTCRHSRSTSGTTSRRRNRCGQCHVAGGQAPQFVRQDDINLAYAAANGIVNLASPRDSRMVQKVAGGHNCWLASAAACADILTTWIPNWAGASPAAARKGIALKAPVIKDPGASKSFPTSPALFATTVYPVVEAVLRALPHLHRRRRAVAVLRVERRGRGVRGGQGQDQPRPAGRSRDWCCRLRNEFHNCWSDCAANATEMEAAIRAFAAPGAGHAGGLVAGAVEGAQAVRRHWSRAAATATRPTRSACGSSRPARAASPTTRAASSRR